MKVLGCILNSLWVSLSWEKNKRKGKNLFSFSDTLEREQNISRFYNALVQFCITATKLLSREAECTSCKKIFDGQSLQVKKY